MFGISFKAKSVARPLRTIEQEVKATRARYNEYLKTTKNDYVAQRGDVQIHHPHTMAGNGYNILKGSLNEISEIAKNAKKEVTFEDIKVVYKKGFEGPYLTPNQKKEASSKILISVTNKGNPLLKPKYQLVDTSQKQKFTLLKQVSNALGEMITGKKEANFDKELGIK